VEEIREAHRRGVELLGQVPRDPSPRPRVVVVGEIYVALTSFANRGTVENLLGREGIEVVEGVTLGGFVRHSLREMKRRARRNHPLLRPLLDALSRRGVRLLEQRIRDPEARPFLVHEVGGDGLLSVAHARHEVEEGADGILHLFPFKCMPEGIAKDAVKEIADLYGVRYLSLSFDKETDIERLKTEISTFASLLRAEMSRRGGGDPSRYWAWKREEIARRKRIGEEVDRLYQRYRRSRLTD
jgi:predicted nucleotide-binding protein (sugar kinase/HSP70/actin superfamily)